MTSSYEQSIELLNATHSFPTRVLVKVIGVNDPDLVVRVVAAIRMELAANEDPPFSTRHTPSGRHVAISLEPHFETAEQVLAVYARVRKIEGIVLLM